MRGMLWVGVGVVVVAGVALAVASPWNRMTVAEGQKLVDLLNAESAKISSGRVVYYVRDHTSRSVDEASQTKEKLLNAPVKSETDEVFTFSGDDWRSEVKPRNSGEDKTPLVILSTYQGLGRQFRAGDVSPQAKKEARIGIDLPRVAQVELLAGRTQTVLQDILWKKARRDGDRVYLHGVREGMDINAVLRTRPSLLLEQLAVTKQVTTDLGEATQTRTRFLIYDFKKDQHAPVSLIDLAQTGAPASQAGLNEFIITRSERNVPLSAADLSIEIPKGTIVTDARVSPPIMYVKRDKELSLNEIQAMDAKRASAGPTVNRPAPNWELTGLDGKPMKLSALRGKPVICTFFASWCGPCAMEARAMESKVWQKYRSRGLQVIGIDTGEHPEQGEPKDLVRTFKEQNGVTYPIVMDEKDEVGRTYDVSSLPTVAFIDARGMLVELESGFMESRLLDSAARLMGDHK